MNSFDFPYTVNQTAQVGKYPRIIGPKPLYNPLRPSSRHIVRPVPIRPRYAAFVVLLTLNPPCACNFVFITSNGHVTMPEVNPPAAPAKARKLSFDLAMAHLSIGVRGTFSRWKLEVVFANGGAEVGGEDANSSAPVGDRVRRSCDIVLVRPGRVTAKLPRAEQERGNLLEAAHRRPREPALCNIRFAPVSCPGVCGEFNPTAPPVTLPLTVIDGH